MGAGMGGESQNGNVPYIIHHRRRRRRRPPVARAQEAFARAQEAVNAKGGGGWGGDHSFFCLRAGRISARFLCVCVRFCQKKARSTTPSNQKS